MTGKLTILVAALLMASAVSIVTSRYQSRSLYVELERGKTQADDLDSVWRRLQSARAELTRNARVDQSARDTLKLVPITPARTIYLNEAPAPQQQEGGQ